MAVTTIPYLIGYASQGDEWQFTGFVFGVTDGNSYIAKMLSGANGDWLFRTPYTPYPQQGVLAFLPYLLLGKISAPPGQHLQLVSLFHIFRYSAGVLAILATYDFLSIFLKSTSVRRWGLAIAILGGGLGWVLVLIGRASVQGSLPLDFYSPESFGFLAIYGLPHLSLARASLLWSFCILLPGVPYEGPTSSFPGFNKVGHFASWLVFRDTPQDRRRAILAGLTWLLMGLAQPLNVVVAWVIAGSFLGFQGLRFQFFAGKLSKPAWEDWFEFFRRVFWAMVISAPLVGYTMVAFSLDPFLRNWTAQNLILSPTPIHYLLAYALLIPLVGTGIVAISRRGGWHDWFPIVWVALLPFLAYAPYNLQRRLPEGIWVALVVLAMIGVESWMEKPSLRARRIGLGWTSLCFITTILLFVGGINAARYMAEPLFRTADQVRAFEMLAEAGEKGEIVLSSFETGNALPAWVPMRVVIGHGPESIQLETLKPQVEKFYHLDTSDDERLDLLDTFGVAYVFWGPAERNLGGWYPGRARYLELIGEAGEYQVYRYLPDAE